MEMPPSEAAAAPPAPALPGLRAAASAPGKCILLGEHAVVYGEPSLSVALDLRTTVAAHRVGDKFRVNGYPLTKKHHLYMQSVLDESGYEEAPVRFELVSDVPSASGIGSSAALTVATTAAIHRLRSEWSIPSIAEHAFRAERGAQGAGSPNDTSVATAGGAVLLAPEKRQDAGLTHLWSIRRDDRVWEVHRADVPELGLVVGFTGVRAKTATQVAKVRRFVEKSAFGRDTVRAVGPLVWDALDAMRGGDLERLGKLMDRCQQHLATMGVNHPRLQELIDAARRTKGALGAKLTGAGGGGSMVVLTTRPDLAAKAIQRAGGAAFRVGASNSGVRAEPALELADLGVVEEASA